MSRGRRRARYRRARVSKKIISFVLFLVIAVAIKDVISDFYKPTLYPEANQYMETNQYTETSDQESIIVAVNDYDNGDERVEESVKERQVSWSPVLISFAAVVILLDVFLLHCILYFRGKQFVHIKTEIGSYIDECNELNEHIEELRSSYIDIKKTDYGEAVYEDLSKNKYKRTALHDFEYEPNVLDCSRSVCDGARKQPFLYVCKYFNISKNEESLEKFESILNNYIAAEDGKEYLAKKKDSILLRISDDIPWYIKKLFDKRLERELGFTEYNFDEAYFPTFTFRYTSAGGNASIKYDVVFDIETLERFVNYLAEYVSFRNTAQGQRRLMTPKLRSFIIERDDYTCRECGNSMWNEPNLLLEVDHIVPISKGGLTTESNLQTLCWKCNRHKGSKMYAM